MHSETAVCLEICVGLKNAVNLERGFEIAVGLDSAVDFESTVGLEIAVSLNSKLYSSQLGKSGFSPMFSNILSYNFKHTLFKHANFSCNTFITFICSLLRLGYFIMLNPHLFEAYFRTKINLHFHLIFI